MKRHITGIGERRQHITLIAVCRQQSADAIRFAIAAGRIAPHQLRAHQSFNDGLIAASIRMARGKNGSEY